MVGWAGVQWNTKLSILIPCYWIFDTNSSENVMALPISVSLFLYVALHYHCTYRMPMVLKMETRWYVSFVITPRLRQKIRRRFPFNWSSVAGIHSATHSPSCVCAVLLIACRLTRCQDVWLPVSSLSSLIYLCAPGRRFIVAEWHNRRLT